MTVALAVSLEVLVLQTRRAGTRLRGILVEAVARAEGRGGLCGVVTKRSFA